MNILVGTSGYSYKEWKGNFYPKGLPDAQMLRHYGERFPTVEINNTFYRMPSGRVLADWSEQVPDAFRFVLKASQRITHQQRLKDCADNLAYLVKQSAGLGEKLGAFLFQLPPNLKKDVPRLRDFLALLPTTRRAAFEFRHESWFDDEVYTLLRERDAALCIAEGEELQVPFVATATWGYVRLRRAEYAAADLCDWAKRIQEQAWRLAFVYFKHEDEGKSPEMAAHFLRVLA